MEIVNQPFKQSLGFRLIEKIQSGHFSVFHFMVAYAKTSGVNRLLPYMRQFKENGGTIKAVVGIDQGGQDQRPAGAVKPNALDNQVQRDHTAAEIHRNHK